jgi:hypothetical protein
MKIYFYIFILYSLIGLAQPLLFLSLAKMLFDQIFGIVMFLAINTAIDTVWGQIVPQKDPIDELRDKVMERFDGLTSHVS